MDRNGGRARRRARDLLARGWPPYVAGGALVIGLLAAALVVASGDGPDGTAARRDERPAASTTEGPARSAPPTTAGPATGPTTPPPSTASGAPGDAGGVADRAPTPAELPGVVDRGDPAATVRAVVDLAASGAMPDEAARYVAGGDPAVVTELFMAAAEGLSSSEVGGCRFDGATASCPVSFTTTYGAPFTAAVSLGRGEPGGGWAVTLVELGEG